MKKFILILLFTFIFSANAQEITKHNVKPPEGYVPDSQTAINIAVSIWIPIYGEERINGQKPFTATLSNGAWTVRGSLPSGWKGGVAVAEISKDTGCILRVSHGK